MPSLKEDIVTACEHHLKDKVHSLTNMVSELSDSANNETKSSAGDKHETGRAMMQLEQEKLGKQLKEAEEQLAEFQKVDFSKQSSLIGQGSLVETDKGYFFMAGSIGKIQVSGKAVFVISRRSPLALVFMGKKQKDTVMFNGVSYRINAVL
jgi:transcription elongation GreA/GreB family factor